MGNKLDLKGYKVGKLTVIDFAESRGGSRYWKTLCECGNEKVVRGTHLKQKLIKSCGCLTDAKREEHKNWRGCGRVPSTYYSKVKKQAENRKKDICFEITIEDMANQFEIQNGKCIYTGLDLDFGKTQRDAKKNRTASLDRKDSNKGYTKDNIQWVHKVVNIMKNDMNESEFFNFINLIHENSYGKYQSKS